MNAQERVELIKAVEQQKGKRAKVLKGLGIPRQTYYQWRKKHQECGITGLAKDSTVAKRIWNRLTPQEKEHVVTFARQHPELSPRLLAVKLTDDGHFSVSEPTVYRLLKNAGLICPMPLPEMPAAREWRHKTTRPDEIWQCDGTKLFIVGWGYYNLVPVLDDYSRKILAGMLKADESGFSVSDAIEQAVGNARKEGHIINEPPKAVQ